MEDIITIKNIITQGLKLGYKSELTNGEIGGLELISGIWVLSNGVELGSTWDIIMSIDFADKLWGDESVNMLHAIVVMNSDDRIKYLGEIFDEQSVLDVSESNASGDFYEQESTPLVMAVRESLGYAKNISIDLYKETCDRVLATLSVPISKSSVTELFESDFMALNSANKIMDGCLPEYLNSIGKGAFSICPECSNKNFEHLDSCSIKFRFINLLYEGSNGC